MPFNRSAYVKQWRRTPTGAASLAWNRLTSRAGAKYNHSECYAHVEVRMTREEFMAWAVPAYEAWFRDRPGEKPSVDRIDSQGHYESGNLRLLPLMENIGRSSFFKNRRAPAGQLWCGACKQYLPIDHFSIDRQRKTGRSTYCRPCKASREKQGRDAKKTQ